MRVEGWLLLLGSLVLGFTCWVMIPLIYSPIEYETAFIIGFISPSIVYFGNKVNKRD